MYRITVRHATGSLNFNDIEKNTWQINQLTNTDPLYADWISANGSGNKDIYSLCSMEFYGLFVGIKDNGYFIRVEPQFEDTDEDYSADTSNDIYKIDSYVSSVALAEP